MPSERRSRAPRRTKLMMILGRRAAAFGVAIHLCCAAAFGQVSDKKPWAWEELPGKSLALLRGPEVVWRFHFGEERTKPGFHPLALPGGRVLTVDAPRDHLWHHGLWFSWKFINGVNYWEHEASTGKPAGRTSWKVAKVEAHDDGSARIELTLNYAPGDRPPIMSETRILTTTAPAADGGFSIDWEGSFTALADCKLDRTPPPGETDGKANGGYAGLSLRLVQLEQRDAITTDAAVEWNTADRFRAVAKGFDYRGIHTSQEVGVAILDHQDNLRAPSPWYAVRSKTMTFVTPAVLGQSPQTMKTGEQFQLRYRVLVHPGRLSVAALNAASDAFRQPSIGSAR